MKVFTVLSFNLFSYLCLLELQDWWEPLFVHFQSFLKLSANWSLFLPCHRNRRNSMKNWHWRYSQSIQMFLFLMCICIIYCIYFYIAYFLPNSINATNQTEATTDAVFIYLTLNNRVPPSCSLNRIFNKFFNANNRSIISCF